MRIKVPKISAPDVSNMTKWWRAESKDFLRDASVGVAFVAAIAILLLAAGYVINRLSGDRAYREKWKDYNDCGWA